MKRIILITLTLLLVINFNGNSQIPEGAIRIDDNAVFKNESGKIIDFSEFNELMNSGKYRMDPVKDKSGKVEYFQLKKATKENKGTDVKKQDIMGSLEQIGKSAPDYKMNDINGKTILSEDTKGKIVVLNFWFATCKPCIDEIPELNKVYDKYKDNPDVVFASITFENTKKVKSFIKEYSFKYPVYANAKEMCDLFKIKGFPTNIILDREGKYSDYLIGGNSNIGQQLSKSIHNALEGKKSGLKQASPKNVMLDPNSIFKLENGAKIPFKEATELLMSKKYKIVPKKDANNEDYYLIQKK